MTKLFASFAALAVMAALCFTGETQAFHVRGAVGAGFRGVNRGHVVNNFRGGFGFNERVIDNFYRRSVREIRVIRVVEPPPVLVQQSLGGYATRDCAGSVGANFDPAFASYSSFSGYSAGAGNILEDVGLGIGLGGNFRGEHGRGEHGRGDHIRRFR